MITPLLIALGMTAVVCLVEELTKCCVRPPKTNV